MFPPGIFSGDFESEADTQPKRQSCL
jgi:hypothetical protein